MTIALAADHAGFALKEKIRLFLIEQGFEINDFGAYDNQSSDYPDFAVPASKSVQKGESQFAILICGTGIGMSMAANKIKGIRCAVCTDVFCATVARAHNDANALSLGARVIDEQKAKEIVTAFLHTGFEGGRHQRRIDKMMEQEKD